MEKPKPASSADVVELKPLLPCICPRQLVQVARTTGYVRVRGEQREKAKCLECGKTWQRARL